MKKALKISGLVALCGVVIRIMAGGLGLREELPFGAGAYYYADIPDFEKYLDWDCYAARLPYWVYVVLFLLWGVLMYLLWLKVDSWGKKRR